MVLGELTKELVVEARAARSQTAGPSDTSGGGEEETATDAEWAMIQWSLAPVGVSFCGEVSLSLSLSLSLSPALSLYLYLSLHLSLLLSSLSLFSLSHTHTHFLSLSLSGRVALPPQGAAGVSRLHPPLPQGPTEPSSGGGACRALDQAPQRLGGGAGGAEVFDGLLLRCAASRRGRCVRERERARNRQTYRQTDRQT